jgi:bacterioferritin-associated ferredoxin
MSHSHDCGCGCGNRGGRVDEPSRDWAQAEGDETVCYCQGVTKAALLTAIEQGAFTAPLLKAMTGAGRGKQCKQRHPLGRTCEADLDELVRLYGGPRPLGAASGSCHH